MDLSFSKRVINDEAASLWCMVYGVVVSMFDFHRSDRGSNPGRGGKNFMFTTTL